MRKYLPAYLGQSLPALLLNILQRLFISTDPQDTDLDLPVTAPQSKLMPLGLCLTSHLKEYLQEQLRKSQDYQLKKFQQPLEEAECKLEHEIAELQDEQEEYKTDLGLTKKDALEELSTEIEDALKEATGEGKELGEVLYE